MRALAPVSTLSAVAPFGEHVERERASRPSLLSLRVSLIKRPLKTDAAGTPRQSLVGRD